MFSLEIQCAPEGLDLLISDLWEWGCAGITEIDEARVRAFFEDSADREDLCRRYPGAIARSEEPRDWVESARALFQPLTVGARFFLVPEWRDDAAPPGRFRITVNPGMAFGTGAHETTQLALEVLERYLEPGMTVLDVGAGSGILAEAAQFLGAAKVFACDIDPDAIAVARRRIARCFIGSVTAVRPAIAGLALANISPEAIIELAPALLACLAPGGLLLASGFEEREMDAVLAALGPPLELRVKGAWSLAVIRKHP